MQYQVPNTGSSGKFSESSFVVSKNFNTEADVDMAFVLGAGFNFTPNFGIEARVKKGIIPVFYSGVDHTNVVFSLGATYTFDVK